MSLGTDTSSTGAVTTGPATFSDPGLSWSDASSASDPSSTTAPADSASADATVPPATSQTPEGQPQQDTTGVPPEHRWPSILDNARNEWREKYGWAEKIDQPTLQRAMEFYQGFNDPGGDPVSLLQQLAERISSDPVHGAKLRSLAARQLAAARGQQQAPPAQAGPTDALRNTEIVDAQGNVVGTIGQLLDAERAQLEQKFAPALTAAEKIEKSERQRQAADAADQFAKTTFGEIATYPGMDDKANQVAVGHAIKAMNLQSDDPRDIRIAVDAAWRQVVLPKLSSTAQSKLLDNLQQKAAASTGVNPGSAAPSTSRKITSFHQLDRTAWD